MIDPLTVFRGDRYNLHAKPVRVLTVNRFWTPTGELISGAVILRGDPVAATPRDLITFCEQAKRPQK